MAIYCNTNFTPVQLDPNLLPGLIGMIGHTLKAKKQFGCGNVILHPSPFLSTVCLSCRIP